MEHKLLKGLTAGLIAAMFIVGPAVVSVFLLILVWPVGWLARGRIRDFFEEEIAKQKKAEDDEFLQRPFQHYGVTYPEPLVLPLSALLNASVFLLVPPLLPFEWLAARSEPVSTWLGEHGSAHFALYLVFCTGFWWTAHKALVQVYRWAGYEVFTSYDELWRQARAARFETKASWFGLALKEAARTKTRTIQELYRLWHGRFTSSRHSVYYATDGLLETLRYLEERFPQEVEDNEARLAFWAFGRSIYQILAARQCPAIAGSLFGLPYPESAREREEARRAKLEKLRGTSPAPKARYAPGPMSQEEALEVLGFVKAPSPEVLMKLRKSLRAESAEDERMAAAFEALLAIEKHTAA